MRRTNVLSRTYALTAEATGGHSERGDRRASADIIV